MSRLPAVLYLLGGLLGLIVLLSLGPWWLIIPGALLWLAGLQLERRRFERRRWWDPPREADQAMVGIAAHARAAAERERREALTRASMRDEL